MTDSVPCSMGWLPSGLKLCLVPWSSPVTLQSFQSFHQGFNCVSNLFCHIHDDQLTKGERFVWVHGFGSFSLRLACGFGPMVRMPWQSPAPCPVARKEKENRTRAPPPPSWAHH